MSPKPCRLHALRRAPQQSSQFRQLGFRRIHTISKGDLKALLPTMKELGLLTGDHGELTCHILRSIASLTFP